MSFRMIILSHEDPIDPRVLAVADVVIHPTDADSQIQAVARQYCYWQPMRVFVAPGQDDCHAVKVIEAVWDEEAPGMAWEVESLEALACSAHGEGACLC